MAEAPLTPFNWSEAASNIADAAAVAPFSPPPKGAAFERQLSSSESDGAAATIAVGAPASPPAAVPLQVHYADGIAVTAAAGGLSAVPSDLIASGAPRGAPLVAHTLASTTHGAVQGILTGMRMLDEDGRAGDASESDAHSVAESDAPLPPAADLSSRAVEAEMQKSSPFGQAASLTLLAADVAKGVIAFAVQEAISKGEMAKTVEPWFQIEKLKSVPELGNKDPRRDRLRSFEFTLRCVLLERKETDAELDEAAATAARAADAVLTGAPEEPEQSSEQRLKRALKEALTEVQETHKRVRAGGAAARTD